MSQSNPSGLCSHPIRFVEGFDQVIDLIEASGFIKQFYILGDDLRRPSAEQNAFFKARECRVFRIRPSGSWNNFFKALGEIESTRADGEDFTRAADLMFISLISAADIGAALARHRAVKNLTCRELYWLKTLELGPEQDDAIEMALGTMAAVPTPLIYKNLTTEQRFELSAFEFTRFTRPVHCPHSVKAMMEGSPIYTGPEVREILLRQQNPVIDNLDVWSNHTVLDSLRAGSKPVMMAEQIQ